MTEPHEPGDMVERVAKALAVSNNDDPDKPLCKLPGNDFQFAWQLYIEDATAALAASGADRMREALERALGFIETLADTDLDEQIADNGMTVGGKLQFDAPALVINLRQALGEPQ